jgi:EmrB/QacA subfamily drug resistance transporter
LLSLGRRRAITAGLLLGMSLAALEATVVSTAMPTVIATLGGLAHYSWVFAAYLLTSTASVPIWGRLSDLYGRRRLYLIGIVVFLVGSTLSGVATTMPQLIVFRAVQGLGAGAVIPLSMTIIGELYSLDERARTQALFSGMWGLASIAGPIVGGYITDSLSWRWVFFLNLPFGALALVVIALAYPSSRRPVAEQVDWMGAALLFGGTTALLIALGGATESGVAWFAVTVALLAGFVIVERRTAHPILPLDLLRYPVVAWSLGVVFMIGMAMFGAIAFVPLFVQGVMGGTATEAGQVLTPLFLGWVSMSIAAARLTVKLGYRPASSSSRSWTRIRPGRCCSSRCSCSGAAWACRCWRSFWRCSTASAARCSGSPPRSISFPAASAPPSASRPWAPSWRATWQPSTFRGWDKKSPKPSRRSTDRRVPSSPWR